MPLRTLQVKPDAGVRKKPQCCALLVHGMGSDPSWWTPFNPGLREIGVAPVALALPSLEAHSPEAWCTMVQQQVRPKPVLLIGHSLGAAVCLTVALDESVGRLVLLACPPFVEGFNPSPPRTKLSPAALARVERFLRIASRRAGQVAVPAVHFVGAKDRSVPVAQARQLPFPVVVIPGVGHQLNRSPHAVSAILKELARRL